ncbi:peroxisomal bifunctional enzyme [Oncorhynchus keta]|uniref:peroxisomal bifunctional enzyme n=1 Tax=Oncorhynchus keta TaxID=8018 RepID=UPI00227BC061|nr:peroxisomal bifunctional enzyme [Oncorhynchus keta]
MATYSRLPGSVALITLQNPPVNALSAAVRQGIVDTVQRALKDPQVTSVVICGQNGKFCGGADIREFAGQMLGPPLVPMIHAIEAVDKPVAAAIEGVALGGGLELALGCHYRIAHSKALLGLPEVTLGLLPGAGGSQRLPRLIGLTAALDLITTGRHISAAEALKLGILDQVTDNNVVDQAVEFVRSVAGQPLDSRRLSTLPCPCPPDVDSLLDKAMVKVRQRSRGALAPVACVQALMAAASLPYTQGMEKERDLLTTLFNSGQARALQYAFFSQRVVGKWSLPSGASWDNSAARTISKAAVIGLGTMGRGIVVALALTGISVVAVETQEKQLAEASQAVPAMLQREAGRRGLATPPGVISFSSNLQDVREVELVIEAVFEDMSLKLQVFRHLTSVCRPGTLLCSNTSGLDIDQLAAVTQSPGLVVGMHFFAPAHVMKLLEVVYGPRSSPEAVATAMQLGKRMGKVSVAVGNCPGFVGNRMLKPYLEQANFLLEEGATPQQVDEALEEFGFPMGVFRMSDLSGLDVGWRIRKEAGLTGPGVESTRTRQGRRYSPLPDQVCEAGRLGQKTGRGWYQYDGPGGRVARSDPWVHIFLEAYRAEHGLVARSIAPEEILERCLYALINEGFNILQDAMAAGPEDIDTIYVFGYGWPRHHGGPMFHAGQVGLGRILERLQHHHHNHPDVPHLKPSTLLRRLVAVGSPPVQKWREFINKERVHSQL